MKAIRLSPLISAPVLLKDYLRNDLNLSRKQIKKYLKVSSQNKILKVRESINLPIDLLNQFLVNPICEKKIDIIFEDHEFLVLEKPTEVNSFSQLYSDSNNCHSFLRSISKNSPLKIDLETHEKGLLYRLDFETSGVLIYLKNEKKFHELRSNFKDIVKEKHYLCLVKGNLNVGKISGYYEQTGNKGRKIKVNSVGNKDDFFSIDCCQLYYCENKNVSLMKVKLHEGKRHQIRSLMAFKNHPILGDKLYGGPSSKRLYLHAISYQILDHTFVSKKLQDFDNYLNIKVQTLLESFEN